MHAPPPTTGVELQRDVALQHGGHRSAGFYRNFAKRFLDVVLVLMSAIPVFIILSVLCAVIALDGRAPLYFQKRIGRNGRVFHMWKLRSMVPNADAQLEAYLAENPEARAEWDRTQKLRNDPRITKIGAFIRKTSLDELPQLVNVLKGDMSLVGPRPMMVDQRTIYPGTAYYVMRPGITGMWQTSVRNESSFSERAIFDARYYREMSFATDVTLIARTFNVVMRGTGV
ncbi:sugar transferase [Primorskyibacter aestuariivivens]|uniref:sugar transferase n=1 Tax=Primorskyibacter aestuariivivens TaxID=1888912 RepID=UPI002301DDCB|nr:sugar transferase [Primorskyibacter aestuariivivens]MDA7429450.1 sugar transferase [Primorskyibacter aestuariivivens]